MTPKPALAVLGVTLALGAPLAQSWLRPWTEATFAHPLDRFMSLWVFWIALALGIAIYGEGFSLATFGIKRGEMPLRARLTELILAVLAALAVALVLIPFSGYVRGLLTDDPAPTLATANILPLWVLFRSYPIAHG